MDNSIDVEQFRDLFNGRVIVIDDLPPGAARELAASVNRPESATNPRAKTAVESVTEPTVLPRNASAAAKPT